MSRYQTKFYEPLSPTGQFRHLGENGGKTASQQATDIWKTILASEPILAMIQPVSRRCAPSPRPEAPPAAPFPRADPERAVRRRRTRKRAGRAGPFTGEEP